MIGVNVVRELTVKFKLSILVDINTNDINKWFGLDALKQFLHSVALKRKVYFTKFGPNF